MKEGDRFEGYVLKNKLGEGGMAEVFRAERVGEDGVAREVCIKRIRQSLAMDSAFVAMFIDEARIASTLRHGNIVPVEYFGRHDGVPFMVMTWVNGVDASKLLMLLKAHQQVMPVDAALHVINCVLRGLEYAHGKRDANGQWLRIVHRDVSPHNILISFTGEVALADFGIAKATSHMHHTDRNIVKGKLAYMAPEQACGMDLDHRTDLFAVRIVAYQLLTGCLPFGDGSNLMKSVSALSKGVREPLRSRRPEVPPAVEAFVDRLLELIPDDRFPDAGAARDELTTMPWLSTGERSLQKLVRAYFGEDACSTLLPRMQLTIPARTMSSVVVTSDATRFALDATRPAVPIKSTLDAESTRAPSAQTVRAAPVRLAPAHETTASPSDITGPFVAVSLVPPRRRSRVLIVSAFVGVGVVLVVSGYVAATLTAGTHTATSIPTFPSQASSVTFTFGPNGNAGSGFTVSNRHDVDAAHASTTGVPSREPATSAPSAYGRVRIVSAPWGTVAIDDGPWHSDTWTYTVSAGQHRARAMIRGAYPVTRDFTVHEGRNPDVTLELPTVRAPQ